MFIFDPSLLPLKEERAANLAQPFYIQVGIGECQVQHMIMDSGSLVNVMPKLVYDQLEVGSLRPTN